MCLGLVLFVSIILGPGLKNLPSGLVSSRNIKMEENGCGSGTKINDEGVCIVDNEDIVNTLIENKFILYDSIKKDVVFVPSNNYSDVKQEAQPKWYRYWLDETNGFDGEKVISWGICNIENNNCQSPCRCSDCAGWRGGNSTDCAGTKIGSGRVFCNLTPGEPGSLDITVRDQCECNNGYNAVNGLCVSPYKINDSSSLNCCPQCVFTSPAEGGCAGTVQCDTNNICEESKVDSPGGNKFPPLRFKVNIPDPRVNIVDNECVDGETELCWSKDGIAKKSSPYIVVNTDSINIFDDILEIDDNFVAEGENEFECVLKCGDTNGLYDGEDKRVTSQLECSKMCLPHLWLWYPVFENVDGNNLVLRGYHQSEKLLRYMAKNIELTHCKNNSCIVSLSVNPDFSRINNCTGCKGCKFNYSNILNNNGFEDREYNCDSCDICYFDQEDNPEPIVCKNLVGCRNCQYTPKDLTILGFEQINTCNSCNALGSEDGCKIYTKDPYVGENNFRNGVSVYNKGGDPNNIDYYGVGGAYNPNSRNSYCDYVVRTGKKTCDNNLSDTKIGWGDGEFDFTLDCTISCIN